MKKVLFITSFFLFALLIIPQKNQVKAAYGSGSTDAGTVNDEGKTSAKGASVCGDEKPGQPVLYEPGHPLLPKATKPGSIRLNWLKASRATHYSVAYGLTSGNYIYGVPDVGNTDNFTVEGLGNRTYYFAVRAVNNCMPGPLSNEWSARARGASSLALGPATGFIPAPKISPSPVKEEGPVLTPTAVPTQEYIPPKGVTPRVERELPQVSPTPTPPPQGFFDRLFGSLRKLLGL